MPLSRVGISQFSNWAVNQVHNNAEMVWDWMAVSIMKGLKN